ncbi:hypothetical protein [Burkholderia sp. BCC0397]|uniref:hypothetical protein n=1 Tax=Burkholderia sp. BCC0397 TaxID=486876 RepID=UPI001588BAB6|nr:hypothetical protein [Burkholderia sp. BCC0397]
MTKELSDALKSVDWNGNVSAFLTNDATIKQIDNACYRLAIWSKQLENVDRGNPALTFVRAMQISAHHAVATASLAIYKAAASSIRSIVENALYYTYFRSHHAELSSLIREDSYHISKSEILAYHKIHTPSFRDLQEKFGLLTRIEKWYSSISAIVHGQVPGIWIEHATLAETKPSPATLKSFLEKFCDAEKIVHDLFLLTIGTEHWDDFSPTAKKLLVTGMSGEHKTMMKLDRH